MTPFEVFLLIVAAILLIVAGVFSALSANQISQIPGYTNDLTLRTAQSWMIWSTVAAWVGVVFLILLLIIYFLVRSADERAGLDFSSSGWVRFFIFIIFAFLLTSAIFATLGVVALNSSSIYQSNIATSKSSFNNGIIALVVGYIGAVLALIAFFISFGNSGAQQATQQQNQQAQKGGQPVIVQQAAPSAAPEAAEAGELAEAAEIAPLLV